MTDERNPSDDALDVIAGFQHRNESLHRHHDLDKPTCAYCTLAAKNALKALTAAGFVVVRAPGLNHGDELTEYEWEWTTPELPTINAVCDLPDDPSEWRLFMLRRPVPEPATKPECPDCRGFKSAYPHLTDEPCGNCGGSGVATTEGNQQ